MTISVVASINTYIICEFHSPVVLSLREAWIVDQVGQTSKMLRERERERGLIFRSQDKVLTLGFHGRTFLFR